MLRLIVWILTLPLIGSFIGFLTKDSINYWYKTLKHAKLTPPNYAFSIVWSILYALIAISGWLIWQDKGSAKVKTIKFLYIAQMLLNWSWTPLFFGLHLIGGSFICLLAIISLVSLLLVKLIQYKPTIVILLLPYWCWLLYAAYLNYYLYQHN